MAAACGDVPGRRLVLAPVWLQSRRMGLDSHPLSPEAGWGLLALPRTSMSRPGQLNLGWSFEQGHCHSWAPILATFLLVLLRWVPMAERLQFRMSVLNTFLCFKQESGACRIPGPFWHQ